MILLNKSRILLVHWTILPWKTKTMCDFFENNHSTEKKSNESSNAKNKLKDML